MSTGKWIVLTVVVVILLIGGFFVWRYMNTYESTDDAQVDGGMTFVSPRIGGTVKAVHIHDQEQVKAGDLLVELDDRDLQVALKQAEANLAEARAQLQGAQPNIPLTATTTQTNITVSSSGVVQAEAQVAGSERDHQSDLAKLREAEASQALANADLARYQKLVAKEEVSKQDYDQKATAAAAATANVESARSMAAASQKMVEQRQAALNDARSRAEQARKNAPQQVAQQQASVSSRKASIEAMQAALDQAKLNLDYTKIYAPISGQVGRKAVDVGMRIEPGQQLMIVIPQDDIWITANFKETQLTRMKEHQRATIKVDAYDQDLEGEVESINPATGAKFSILPPENTSGNFVKVVQRVPVRLRLKPGQDPQHRLRRGMSVEPKVWLQ